MRLEAHSYIENYFLFFFLYKGFSSENQSPPMTFLSSKTQTLAYLIKGFCSVLTSKIWSSTGSYF